LKRVLSTAEIHPDPCRTAEPIHRRRFLRLGLLAVSACLLPLPLAAAPKKHPAAERRLSFFNTHTGERIDACYHRAGGYDPCALRSIYHVLRDHRSGEVHPIDHGLLDMLYTLSLRWKEPRPFHVISGYRSAGTNAVLRRRNRGVATHSLHVYGKAIDVRVPGIPTRTLRKSALSLAAGGVGYYPRSDFVHLDVGRVRAW
jgi:uncharacterized protein YcbK (DUF882 family)